MANLTNARRDLMKPGTILYVVMHSVHDNTKAHFSRQIFSTLEEARAYLERQDEPGYIKKAQTVADTDQLESLGRVE